MPLPFRLNHINITIALWEKFYPKSWATGLS